MFWKVERLASRTVVRGVLDAPVFDHSKKLCASRAYHHNRLLVPFSPYCDIVIDTCHFISLESLVTRMGFGACLGALISEPCRNRYETTHARRKSLVMMSTSGKIVKRWRLRGTFAS